MTRPLALLALATLSSCLAFDYTNEEVAFRYDDETDVLEVATVYQGLHVAAGELHATDDPRGHERAEVAKAAELLSSMAARRRYFLFCDWPFVVDLDDPALEEGEPQDDPQQEALRQAALEFAAGVVVDRASLFVDEAGQLGFAQHALVRDASRGVELLNRALSLSLLANREVFTAEDARGAQLDGLERLSAATRRRWVARAEAGEPWLRLADGGFELSVPLAPEELARGLDGLVREASGSDPAGLALLLPLLGAITAIDYEEQILVLRLAPPPSGWLEFAFDRSDREANGALLGLLRERAADLPARPSAEMRAWARGEER